MMKVIFKNVQIVSGDGLRTADVGIDGGKIVKIGDLSGEQADREIDGAGRHLLPGLIDMHVHFREPGLEDKGTFMTESKAAVAGGVTTVFDMPNTKPPTLTVADLKEKRELAEDQFYCNYGFYMGTSEDNIDEIKKVGNIAGTKIYMGSSTGNMLLDKPSLIEKVLDSGVRVVVHAENEEIIRENMKHFANSDPHDFSIHSKIRSSEAAHIAVKEVLRLAARHNRHVHITHMSTAEEVQEVRYAKAHGQSVSCDVTPHHLFLTTDEYARRGGLVQMNPPLRTQEDRQALWKGIRDGTIDCIATDHAPHTRSEKEQAYGEVPSGVPGVQTMLPLLLTAVHHGDLDISDVVRLVCEKPAELFGLSLKGYVAEDFDADLVLVDLENEHELMPSELLYKCGWSPFAGWKMRGWPAVTLVGGEVVFDKGEIVGRPQGREVEFG